MENGYSQDQGKQEDAISKTGKSGSKTGSGKASKDFYLSGKKLFFYFVLVMISLFVTSVLFVIFFAFFYGNFCGLGRI